ncbi:MAG TPA: type II secretion system protein GspM [Gallionella sp.]|nr:type II secretion system protein GspM [Gallionella sp.]
MKRYWRLARVWIDKLSLRERALIFLAVAFVLAALLNLVLLDPLFEQKKTLTAQMIQRQEKTKQLQAQMAVLVQSRRDESQAPLHARLAQLKQQLADQESYLQSHREHLIEPSRMAGLLEQVLNNNGRLQLLSLQTLPVSPLIEQQPAAAGGKAQKQIYKHGVQIRVRGSYPELLRYVSALEKLPVQVFWGEVSLQTEQYPDSVLALTVYTLSLDKTWLTV